MIIHQNIPILNSTLKEKLYSYHEDEELNNNTIEIFSSLYNYHLIDKYSKIDHFYCIRRILAMESRVGSHYLESLLLLNLSTPRNIMNNNYRAW